VRWRRGSGQPTCDGGEAEEKLVAREGAAVKENLRAHGDD
jgi:hypothetical protein